MLPVACAAQVAGVARARRHLVRIGGLQYVGDVIDANRPADDVGADALERVDRVEIGDAEHLDRHIWVDLTRLAW